MNKLEKISFAIFLFIGIVFISIGVMFSVTVYDYSNKVNTNGVISKIDNNSSTPKVYITYTVDNVTHESLLNGYSSTFKVGDEVKMYYDKEDVNEIGIKSFDLIFLVFPCLGAIFSLIGIIGLSINGNSKLKETGELSYAKYVEVTINKHYNVNGVHPYNIICNLDGEEIKSANLWTDPTDILESKHITSFPVYINPKNRKKYYMDISEIEKYL